MVVYVHMYSTELVEEKARYCRVARGCRTLLRVMVVGG